MKKMKAVVALILVVALCAALFAACSAKKPAEEAGSEAQQNEAQQTAVEENNAAEENTAVEENNAAEENSAAEENPAVEENNADEADADPFIGEFAGEDGNTLEIGLTENATHSVRLNIPRLTTFDDGEGNMSDGGLSFQVTDPNGEPLYGMINLDEEDPGQNALILVITDSKWSLLPNDTEFRFVRAIPKSEQTGTAGSRIPLKDNYPEAEKQVIAAVERYLLDALAGKIDDVEVTVDKIYSAEDEDAIDALKEMELGMNEVAFSVNYKLHPAEGVEDLMQFTAANGEIDEESGWIINKSNIGILRPNPDGEGYIITDFGTGF